MVAAHELAGRLGTVEPGAVDQPPPGLDLPASPAASGKGAFFDDAEVVIDVAFVDPPVL